MSEHTPLLPCPLCDGKAYCNTVNRESWQGHSGIYVSCQRKSCRLSGRIYPTHLKAIEAWNKRSDHAAEVERLEAENKRLKDALKLAQPILDEQLQSLCRSYCLPCEVGETFDYSELKEPELGWITKTEAALDAVDVALAGGKGEDDAD